MAQSVRSPYEVAATRALDLIMTDVKMSLCAHRLGGDIVVVDMVHMIKGDPPGVQNLRNVVYAPRLELTTAAVQSRVDKVRATAIAQRQFYVDSGLPMPGTSVLPLHPGRTQDIQETAPPPAEARHQIVVTAAGLPDDANDAIATMLTAAMRYKLLALPS